MALDDDDMTSVEGPADSGAGEGTPGHQDGGADGGAADGVSGAAQADRQAIRATAPIVRFVVMRAPPNAYLLGLARCPIGSAPDPK